MATKRSITEDSIKFSTGKGIAILEGYKSLQHLPLESSEFFKTRNELFTECWGNIEDQIQQIVTAVNEKVCEGVLQFAHKSKEKLDQLFQSTSNENLEGAGPASGLVVPPRVCLHTAAVMAGVSLADHQLLFHTLTESLKTLSPHLATLRARVCNPGIKAAMRSIITQLVMSEEQVLSGSDEEEDFSMPRSVRKKPVGTPRVKRTPRHAAEDSEEADSEEILRPKSKKRALFGLPGKSDNTGIGKSTGKTDASSPNKVDDEQETPQSTRSTRSRRNGGETVTTPQKTLPTDSKLQRTPRSKKATPKSTCKTPVTKTPAAMTDVGMCTPKSSRRGISGGEGVCGTPGSRRNGVKQPQYSMSTLCGWYRENAQDTDRRPLVVLFIEDYEEFSPKIFQDLVLSLVSHVVEFPVLLVLGMSVPVSLLHQTLPHHVVSHLSLQQFCVQQPSTTLDCILTDVLMSPSLPFKLGPQAFQLLKKQFLESNLSLSGLCKTLKLSLMEHFYWQPLSVLCSTSIQQDRWPPLPPGLCEAVRATPSFQRHVETLPPAQRLALLTKDAPLITEVKKLTKELFEYQQVLIPMLQCLLYFTHSLPNTPLGHKLHELYALSLEKPMTQHSSFKEAWNLVNMLGRASLNKVVKLCVVELEEAKSSGVHAPLLTNALRMFYKYEEELPQVVGTEVDKKQLNTDDKPRRVGQIPSSKASFESLRKSFLSYLLSVFSKLPAPNSLVLHEALYFNQSHSLQSHLAPAPRTCLQQALTDHTHFLAPPQQKKRKKKSEAAPAPDLCLLYSLYLESGKLINVSDWLQSFAAVVQQEGVSDKSSVAPTVQSRFQQALSELQFLGYLRHTQRKTDHLQKLTMEHAKDEYTL